MVKLVLSNKILLLENNKKEGNTPMIRSIYRILPLVVLSAAVTSCSSTRPQVNPVKAVTKAPAVTKPVQKQIAIKNIPVVYEKRSPKKVVAQRTRHRPVQRKRYQPIKRNTQLTNSFNNRLSNAALGRLNSKVRYDGAYVKIAYPGGDVSPHTGVCTDVVIRSYRKLGIDLQQQVHLDMSAAFNQYPNPKKWGLSKPDANIDHRRVYNLRKFFERRGAALPITRDARNYKPGDLVTWMVGPHLPHIGIVVNKRSKADPNRFMIVHNIAHGPQMEDILFTFPITGHYRYTPKHMGNIPAKRTYTQNNRALSHDQLIQAANILGTNTRTAQANKASRPSNQQLSNQQLLNQVVRLNSANNSTKSKGVKIANLSAAEIQSLLGR